MSYKRRKPVDEREMLKTRWQGHHSICQKLREIYNETENENIKLNCRVAMAMAKAMQEQLKKYKKQKEARENGDS